MNQDMTYCNSRCPFRGGCRRHYTNNLTGDPDRKVWMAEFRTRGRFDSPCPHYIKKEEAR